MNEQPVNTKRRQRDGRARIDCPNCGEPFQSSYCSACGQNNRSRRLSLRSVFGPLIEEITELELPILRTIVGLTVRPGSVCRDYVQGKRKRYTNPVKYCFLTGALFVLVIQVFDLHADEGLQNVLVGTAFHVGTPSEGEPPDSFKQVSNDLRNFVEGWLQVVNMLIIPMLVPLTMIMYRRARLNFAEHSVFLLYLFGHIFLLGIPLLLAGLYAHFASWLAMQVWPLIYMVWAACVFYPGNWFMHTLKMLAVVIAKTVAAGFLGMVMAIGFVLVKILFG